MAPLFKCITIAINSLCYMDFPLFWIKRTLLMQAISLPSCMRTTPNPNLKVSILTINSFKKFGNTKTSTIDITFILLKALVVSSFQTNTSFFSNHMKGSTIFMYPQTNLQKYLINLKNPLKSHKSFSTGHSFIVWTFRGSASIFSIKTICLK